MGKARKGIISNELKERQKELRHFLKENNVTHKELRPIGFSIDIRTIPDDKVQEFLIIANKVKYDE